MGNKESKGLELLSPGWVMDIVRVTEGPWALKGIKKLFKRVELPPQGTLGK